MPESPFLKHLIERLNQNRVIILYGGMEGESTAPQVGLAAELVNECGAHCSFCRDLGRCQKPASCVVSPMTVCQAYQGYYGRQALIARVQTYYADRARPTAVQRAIAALPVTTIITTTYDDGMAVALREAGRSVSLVARDTDIPFVDDTGRVQLIHLHGVLSQPDTLVLSEDAADDLFGNLPTLATILRGDFARKTLLFIGYSLSDRHFGVLYRQATQPIARFAPRSYAVQWPVDELAARRWRETIEVIAAEPLEFLHKLQGAAATPAVQPITRVLPKEPYKFLDFFTDEDEGIFHGRQRDAEHLMGRVLAHPFTVLYGESGTGKTSLIRAALEPRLKQDGYAVAYARPIADPWQTVQDAICSALPGASAAGGGWRELAATGKAADSPLLLVLDQFEELFIRQGSETRAQFLGALRDLLDGTAPQVRCLLALRSEYLARLDELEPYVGRDPLRERMRLYNFGPQEARDAIAIPAVDFGIPLEPELLDRLVLDLQQDGIAPAQLQIVCYVLWKDWHDRGRLAEGITLAGYAGMGGTQTILAEYLDNVIRDLSKGDSVEGSGLGLGTEDARCAAQAVLKSMVTGEQTKTPVSRDVLLRSKTVAQLKWGARELQALLHYLQNRRVIRHIAQIDRYELAHEVMIRKVWGWFSDEEKALLDLQDMLARATTDYVKFHSPLALERMLLLTDNVGQLSLQPANLEMLLVSAIEHNLDTKEWVRRIGSDKALEVLAGLLKEDRPKLQPRIATALGATRSAKAIRYLQDLLQDANEETFRAAVQAVADIDHPSVADLLYRIVQRETKFSRVAYAIEALEHTKSAESLNRLVSIALEHPNQHARNRAVHALQHTYPSSNGELGALLLRSVQPEEHKALFELALDWMLKAEMANWQDVFNGLETAKRLHITNTLETARKPNSCSVLIAMLLDEDSGVRQAAAAALGKLGDVRAVEPLLVALNDASPVVRQAATVALSKLGDIRAVEPLLVALRSADGETANEDRQSAIRALGLIWDLPNVVQLGAREPGVRQAAAAALGELGDARAVEPLLVTLHDANPGVSRATAAALGQLGDARAVEPLLVTLNDAEGSVRQAAAAALAYLDPELVLKPLITTLENPDVLARQAAATALGQLGDARVVEPLLVALNDAERSVFQAAVAALAQLDPELVLEPLTRTLQSPSVLARQAAATALGQLRDTRAVEPLLGALRTAAGKTASEDRQSAIRALGQIWDLPSVVQLGASDPGGRRAAAAALGKLGDARAVEPLLVALRTAAGETAKEDRQSAIRALGQIWDLPSIVQLGASDPGGRRAAAAALGKLGDARAVEPLLATLNDADAIVRQAVAAALGQLGDACAVEPLLTTLNDANASVGRAAVVALGKLGDARAVEPLLATLNDADVGTRLLTATALGKLGDARAVEPLLGTLNDAEAVVRQAAAAALGKLRDTRAVEPLLATLNDAERSVHQAAVAALAQLDPELVLEPLTRTLQSPSVFARQAAATALGQLRDTRAVEPLLGALNDANASVRLLAAAALAQFDPELVLEPLTRTLQSPSVLARRTAAVALGQLADARAVEPLLATLNDVDEDRQSAIRALGQIWALPSVVQLGASDPGVRRAAAAALGKLGDARAVEPLLATLNDAERSVHQAAVAALAQLDPELVLEPLTRTLQSPSVLARQAAATALGQLRDTRAVEPLLVALREPAVDVRRIAAIALGMLKDARAVESLLVALNDAEPVVRHAAATALGQSGDARAVVPLLVALNDANSSVHQAAITALVELGPELVLEPLTRALQSPSVIAQQAAAVALGKLGDTRAVEPLLVALRGSTVGVRRAAAVALGQLGDARAVESLLANRQDANASVRQAVATALNQLGYIRRV